MPRGSKIFNNLRKVRFGKRFFVRTDCVLVDAESGISYSGCAVGFSARILSVSPDVTAGGGTFISWLMILKDHSSSLEIFSATCCVC